MAYIESLIDQIGNLSGLRLDELSFEALDTLTSILPKFAEILNSDATLDGIIDKYVELLNSCS